MASVPQLARSLDRFPRLVDNFMGRVKKTALRGMLAYTPPVTHTMSPGVEPDRTQRPVRELRAHIVAQLLGDPKTPRSPAPTKTPPTPSPQFNWAYTTSKGEPVRARGAVRLPLVVPRPGQKYRPNRTVDAFAWLQANTRLVSKRGTHVRRALNPGVSPDRLVWTTRPSWRAAAKRFSLRAGNFLSGWTEADRWARSGGGASVLSKVLPGNGSYGRHGDVVAAQGDDIADTTLVNDEVPMDRAMQGFAQRVIDSNVEREIRRAVSVHLPYFQESLKKIQL